MNDNKLLIPSKEQILSWIRTICDMGYRRPGSKVDHKVEDFLVQILREFGIPDVKKEEMGALAVQQIVHMIENKKQSAEKILVPVELIMRSSTKMESEHRENWKEVIFEFFTILRQ